MPWIIFSAGSQIMLEQLFEEAFQQLVFGLDELA